MREYIDTKYEGFSLVEMLLTIVIMTIIMLLSSTILTTLIKVSTVGSDKIQARNESEYVLELVRRSVRNSDPSDVYLFQTHFKYDETNYRHFDVDQQAVVESEGASLSELYGSPVGQNVSANEIQFRPYGFRDWICLGFFSSREDPEIGYILWSSGENLFDNNESCFSSGGEHDYLIVLNSGHINIEDFDISYSLSGDGNYIIRFDVISKPLNWYLGPGSPINRQIFRQAVVSTEGIAW